MTYLQDGKGNKSLMRLLVLIVVVTGCAVVVACTVAMFMDKAGAVPVAATGGGMVGFVSLAKAWQKKSEESHGVA